MGRLLVSVGLMFGASAAISALTTTVDPYGIRFPRLTLALVVLGEALSTASLLVGSLSVIVRFPTGRRTSRRGLVVELLIVGALLGQMVSGSLPDSPRHRVRRSPCRPSAPTRWLPSTSSCATAGRRRWSAPSSAG